MKIILALIALGSFATLSADCQSCYSSERYVPSPCQAGLNHGYPVQQAQVRADKQPNFQPAVPNPPNVQNQPAAPIQSADQNQPAASNPPNVQNPPAIANPPAAPIPPNDKSQPAVSIQPNDQNQHPNPLNFPTAPPSASPSLQNSNSHLDHPQDFASTPQDEQLNAKIREKLNGEWPFKGNETLGIRTANGAVVVMGTVDHIEDVQKIIDLIKDVENVKSVNSQLLVKNG